MGVHFLLKATLQIAQKHRLLQDEVKLAAIDSTGYEAGHRSEYFGRRCGIRKRRFPKLTAVCDVSTHLFLSASVRQGPFSDQRDFKPRLRDAHAVIPIREFLADAGYDSEENHIFVHDELGGRSVIPPLIGRPSAKKPKGYYRRQMAERFPREQYGQRWQIESCFSQDKRRFGSDIAGHKPQSQRRELLLRILVHNIAMIAERIGTSGTNFIRWLANAFNRAGRS